MKERSIRVKRQSVALPLKEKLYIKKAIDLLEREVSPEDLASLRVAVLANTVSSLTWTKKWTSWLG